MADFCTVCAEDIGWTVDIDLKEIYSSLHNGDYVTCLCEDCNMLAIKKENDNILFYNSKYNDFVSPHSHFTKQKYEIFKSISGILQ